jgi:hypothetical protein
MFRSGFRVPETKLSYFILNIHSRFVPAGGFFERIGKGIAGQGAQNRKSRTAQAFRRFDAYGAAPTGGAPGYILYFSGMQIASRLRQKSHI